MTRELLASFMRTHVHCLLYTMIKKKYMWLYTKKKIKSCRSLMLWGFFVAGGPRTLVKIDGNVHSPEYQAKGMLHVSGYKLLWLGHTEMVAEQ